MQTVGGQLIAVDAVPKAMRASLYPNDIGTLGAYSLGAFTGVLPAALSANSEIFQFRWISSVALALIRRVKISASVTTTYFVAGVPVQLDMKVARAWSADGSGGTAIVFSTNNTNKRRTRFPLSKLSDTGVRIASTAALGAGTKTLDTNAIAALAASGPTADNGTIFPAGTVLWERNPDAEYPLILDTNEGFVIRSVAVPATGTWEVAVEVDWMEMQAFPA